MGATVNVLIEGPGWAPHSLDVHAGRFPLSVEAHLMNMTARLVPGATTVTTNARYYSLHGAVSLEAQRRGLSFDKTLELLRRSEVIVAGASVLHPDEVSGISHGHDRIKPRMDEADELDVKALSIPRSGYANPLSGFLGPYLGSELTLKILASTAMEPGGRIEPNVLGNSFDGLFDLAERDRVPISELANHPHLSIGALRTSPDGPWLARLFAASNLEEPTATDNVRRGTMRLLARAVKATPKFGAVESFRRLIAYGDALRTDPIVASVPEAEPWRGTLFRHESVGAWRVLWAWLVNQIDGLTLPSELCASLAAALPTGTLGSFLDDLPSTTDPAGNPLPAEDLVRTGALSEPATCLAIIALGARRSRELEGNARAAFIGDQRKVALLSPVWMATWLDDRRDQHLDMVAAELVQVLLDRSRRIALKKVRVNTNGGIWLPSRIHERGDYLYKVGNEGRGNVGLRVDQLARIMTALGIIIECEDGWQVTATGDSLLNVN